MKILVFCPYYPPHTGGLESHSDEFNRYLAQNGTDVVVFTPNIPASNINEETRYGRVRIIRYPAFEIIPNYPVPKLWHPTFAKQFVGLFRSKFDVVISRTRFFLSSLLALLYAKLNRVRWIHIEHGSDFVKLSSPVKSAIAKAYDQTFGRIILHYSDTNISISKAVQSFVEKFDGRFSPIIYRGIDFASIDMIATDTVIKNKHPGKIIIVTAARLYKWKGIEFSIEAIRALPEEIRSKIVFFILGDGEDFARLRKLSRDLPVEMLGNLPREKVVSIFKASDIYIHSSLPGGGLSTSLLEAMYCGCAIVSSKNEGAEEVIENNKNGQLVETPTPENLSQSLMALLNRPEQREMLGRTAQQSIRGRFPWEKSIRKYLDILETL